MLFMQRVGLLRYILGFAALFLLFRLIDAGPGAAKITSPLLTGRISCEPNKASSSLEQNSPEPEQVARDASCAQQHLKRYAPAGALTVFGSARTQEDKPSYQNIRAFARLWTLKHGSRYPILTGGGQGIMEAANRGASEAGGESLSITTFFAESGEGLNRYSTHSYAATSFSQREADLVDSAAAVVVAPGGFGTEWEIFEVLSKLQTHRKSAVPLVLLGAREEWASLLQRLASMQAQGTIAEGDPALLKVAETPEQALALLDQALRADGH